MADPAVSSIAKRQPPPPRPEFIIGATEREPFKRRHATLISDREPYLAEMRDISDYCTPRTGKFLRSGPRAPHRPNKIINTTPTLASRTLGSGLMGGASSPARPWFKLGTPDSDLNEFSRVRSYLGQSAKVLMRLFARSNYYNATHQQYRNLGNFGIAPMLIEEDFQEGLRCTTYAPGEYMVDVNDRGVVDICYREFQMTVWNMVRKFGDKCSDTIKNLYDSGTYGALVTVVHAIEPNYDQIRGIGGPLSMPYVEVYFELSGHDDAILRRRGFEEWPAPCPRWDVDPGDAYGGNHPGSDALGDMKAIQVLERRKAQGIDKGITPPTQGPGAAGTNPVTHAPGGHTYLPMTQRGAKIESLYKIEPSMIQVTAAEIREHENRINRCYYVDLFLMLAQTDRREITAREVDEKHEEKLLALGPMIERLHNEKLNYDIRRVWGIAERHGLLPPPPEEIRGKELRVEYISVLAQAQRAVSIGTTERIAGFVGNLSGLYPEVSDKFNPDEAVDRYADNIGAEEGIIRSDDDVDKMRAERRQREAAEQAQAQAMQMAGGAKLLSDVEVTPDNLIGRIAGA